MADLEQRKQKYEPVLRTPEIEGAQGAAPQSCRRSIGSAAIVVSETMATRRPGILNQLLASGGPALFSQLAGGGGGLAALLAGGAKQFTPQQAEQVSPEAVQQLAAHAEKADPWLIDKASAFYSEHLTLIKTLGGAALTVGASGRIVAVPRNFAADVQAEP